MSLALAVLAIFLLFAVLVFASQDAERSGSLHGGTAYCPPPPTASPPTPPRREGYAPKPAPMPGRLRPQPLRLFVVHETCPQCGHRAGGADVGDEDDEQTVLDSRGGEK